MEKGFPEFPEKDKSLADICENIFRHHDARAVFLGWEKLRLLYNLVLTAVVVLFFLVGRSPPDAMAWGRLVSYAVFANICFCAGPVCEDYLNWLGCDRMSARGFLFVMGTILAMALAVCTMGLGW